jgi:subtilase family serine protease
MAGALLSAAALLGTPELQAQGSRIAPRITTDVNESSLTTLRGNVSRLARAEYDQGEASPSTQLTQISLVLSRSAEQQAALDQYLAQLQDKSSPNYHKWLTSDEFGQLYGPADSDIAALVAWLQSHGLMLETISKGRSNIAFSGTVSQVEEAFHTSIHSFQANGQQFYSNTTDPQIPSALAPVVKGVAHLNTIRPQPQSVRGSSGRFNPETKRMEPAVTGVSEGAAPYLESSTGGDFLWIVPGDAATIYDTPNSFNLNFTSGTSYTGSGVKIGIGGVASIGTGSIVTAYRSTFLGSAYATAPTIVVTGTNLYTDSSDVDEAYIDTELSGGMAPGAAIYYYPSRDLTSGIQTAIDDNLVDIFSLSYGECEKDMGTSLNEQYNSLWQQAAAQGIAVTVASGDTGSASCDGDGNTLPKVASDGFSVSGFASTPYNIAVGGTNFYALDSSFSTYVSTTNGTDYRTARSYIPESSWNDSTTVDGLISANVPYTGSNTNFYLAAGGGGASSCSTYTSGTCTSGYSKPSWQYGAGVASDGVRDLPDVSLMAGSGNDNATWVVCDSDVESGEELDCAASDSGFSFDGYGGTSTATPTFAGILALVQQETGSRLGQAAQTLYELYNGSDKGSIFHDVTVGNNSVPCTSGTANCSLTKTGGYYFESGYNTGSGYDLATGLGSVDATKLITYWSTANGTATATATVKVTAPTPNPVTTAESLSVPVSVSGSSGLEATPSGTVTLTSGSYSSGAQTLVSGSYTFDVPAGSLTVGTDTLTVTYGGDSVYASASNNSTTVQVTASSSSATYSLSAANISSLTPGATTGNTSTITVTAVDGYAGTVTLSCALTSPTNLTDPPTCSIPSTAVSMGGTAAATVTTTAATSGALAYPKRPGKGSGLFGAGGGAVLACLVLLGIPARRRRWRSMLGLLVVMAALGGLSACSGGASSSGNSTSSTGTTAGTYTFTVTGTGNPSVTPAPTTPFTVTVN